MEKIAFQTNVPVEVALATIDGLEKDSQFGGKQHMFRTIDGRAFFVSEAVGNILTAQMRKLGVKPGEPVDIVKAEVASGNGRKTIQWQAYKVGFEPDDVPVGHQPDGTFVVPAMAGASAVTPAPVAATNNGNAVSSSHSNSGNGSKQNGNGANATPFGARDTALADALKTAVAAAHAAQEYAKQIGYAAMPQFTSEDLRTMANCLLINREGGSRK